MTAWPRTNTDRIAPGESHPLVEGVICARMCGCRRHDGLAGGVEDGEICMTTDADRSLVRRHPEEPCRVAAADVDEDVQRQLALLAAPVEEHDQARTDARSPLGHFANRCPSFSVRR